MKNLETETRLDVIHRSVLSVDQPCEPLAFDMYHATKLWQQRSDLT